MRAMYIFVLVLSMVSGGVQAASKLIGFNKEMEVVRGDIEDKVDQGTVEYLLESQPLGFQLIGIGTTDHSPDNGELILLGTAENPKILWAHGESLAYEEAKDLNFILLNMAVTDPREARVFHVTGAGDLYASVIRTIVDNLKEGTFAVRAEGRMKGVSVGVVHDLSEDGIDLSRLKDYMWYSNIEGLESWVVAGIFSTEEIVQDHATGRGNLLHLHGISENVGKGGHIFNAGEYDMMLTVYPITRCKRVFINRKF